MTNVETQKQIYRDNSKIFHDCSYTTPSGHTVHLPDSHELLDGSKVYTEAFSVADHPLYPSPTLYNIIEGDVLLAAKSLIERGLNPAVLSFANAYYPCGLYEEGAPHREEHLCRATTLSQSLLLMAQLSPSAYPMDMKHGGIYSRVTVFRDTQNLCYQLLDTPWQLSVISVAALNLRGSNHHKHVVRNLEYAVHGEQSMTPEGRDIMLNKIRTIYRITIANGHDSIILGAWGCGVYKQRPQLIAQMFGQILDEQEFKNKFKVVQSVIEDHKQYVQYVRAVEGNDRFKCSDRPAYFCFRVLDDNIWGAEYPGDSNEKLAAEKIQHAIDFGITHFIDLTEPGELPPYQHLLPCDGSISYMRFPIKDARAPSSVEDVCLLLLTMEKILQDPRHKIYLHCWGGVGRTGTISACWIARQYSYNYCIVMSRLQTIWKTCLKSYSQPIPDHWSQKQFINDFIDYLRHQKMIDYARQLFTRMLTKTKLSHPDYTDGAIIDVTYRSLHEKYVDGGYLTFWNQNNHKTEDLHFVQQIIRNEHETKSILKQILELCNTNND